MDFVIAEQFSVAWPAAAAAAMSTSGRTESSTPLSTIPKEPSCTYALCDLVARVPVKQPNAPPPKTYYVYRFYWDRLLVGSGGLCPMCGMTEARVRFEQTRDEIDAAGHEVSSQLRYKADYCCDECFGRKLMLVTPKGSSRTLFDPPHGRTTPPEEDFY